MHLSLLLRAALQPEAPCSLVEGLIALPQTAPHSAAKPGKLLARQDPPWWGCAELGRPGAPARSPERLSQHHGPWGKTTKHRIVKPHHLLCLYYSHPSFCLCQILLKYSLDCGCADGNVGGCESLQTYGVFLRKVPWCPLGVQKVQLPLSPCL